MNLPSALVTKVSAVFLLALAGWLTTPNAKAQAPTVIAALPYTISAPGDYVLNSNLTYNASTGSAITFAIGNVTLDFKGHFISGLAAGAGTSATGLFANNRANITIRNGTIVGFLYGIRLTGIFGSSGNNVNNIIENMRTPSNRSIGIYIQSGITCRVENCQVNKIGGSTVTNQAIGISADSVLIRNNQVSTVTPGAGGASFGIVCSMGFVVDNQVDNCDIGIDMGPTVKYLNNLTSSVPTPFLGGVNAGHNN